MEIFSWSRWRAPNLFDEYTEGETWRRRVSLSLSPSVSIHQVFYIGLMRNCRGSAVNSCQYEISFVLFRYSDLRTIHRGRDVPPYRCIMVTCGLLVLTILHKKVACALLSAKINITGLSAWERCLRFKECCKGTDTFARDCKKSRQILWNTDLHNNN